jgi:hypothetical protein
LTFEQRNLIMITALMENLECQRKLIWNWNTESFDQLVSNSEEAAEWDKFVCVAVSQ